MSPKEPTANDVADTYWARVMATLDALPKVHIATVRVVTDPKTGISTRECETVRFTVPR